MKTKRNNKAVRIAGWLIGLGVSGFMVLGIPSGAGADGPWTTFGYVLSGEPDASYTTWKAGTSDMPYTGSSLYPDGENHYWYTDAGNVNNGVWEWNDIFVTKIDYQVNSGTGAHSGWYAVVSQEIKSSDPGYTMFPEVSLAEIPVPRLDAVRTGEVDLSWDAVQGEGATAVVAGYDLYYYQTAVTDDVPSEAVDNWTLYSDKVTTTFITVSGLDSESYYYFALKIAYADNFSTDYVSGNSIEINPDLAGTVVLAFNAEGIENGVKLDWITETEAEGVGFNLYRSTDPEGDFVQVNTELIPGQGSPESGASYEYNDNGLEPGVEYYYLLEGVEAGGNESHGPVSGAPVEPTPDPEDPPKKVKGSGGKTDTPPADDGGDTGDIGEEGEGKGNKKDSLLTAVSPETYTPTSANIGGGYMIFPGGCGAEGGMGFGFIPLMGGLFFLRKKSRKK